MSRKDCAVTAMLSSVCVLELQREVDSMVLQTYRCGASSYEKWIDVFLKLQDC